METLKKALYATVIVVVIAFGASFLISPAFKVERSLEINASPDKVFSYIVDLKQWKKWGVWYERDPKMQMTYSGPDNQVGMKSEWVSEKEGSGYMEITKVVPDTVLEYKLVFPDFDMQSQGKLVLEAKGDKTLVTWSDSGEVKGNPLNRIFILFIDDMIGPDFEAGLINLRRVAED
ncbi:SRPBCC family protein [Paraneptunicella aestuarii]|uniref:SRPBCC family protein n=1 Tax=Paraneptunicella aestuarii TaxID=2831148 RepID=UPI001E2E28F2|nr:SRPBCC family protein [Paraneptunicella aestuarii]UAA40535.1 SRPBCC family protein [Paraneptunicella aestuarii]